MKRNSKSPTSRKTPAVSASMGQRNHLLKWRLRAHLTAPEAPAAPEAFKPSYVLSFNDGANKTEWSPNVLLMQGERLFLACECMVTFSGHPDDVLCYMLPAGGWTDTKKLRECDVLEITVPEALQWMDKSFSALTTDDTASQLKAFIKLLLNWQSRQ